MGKLTPHWDTAYIGQIEKVVGRCSLQMGSIRFHFVGTLALKICLIHKVEGSDVVLRPHRSMVLYRCVSALTSMRCNQSEVAEPSSVLSHSSVLSSLRYRLSHLFITKINRFRRWAAYKR